MVCSDLKGVIYMSKLMGKIIVKGEETGVFEGFSSLKVRYLRTSRCFEFRGFRLSKKKEEEELIKECGITLEEIGEGFSKDRVIVHEDILSCLILADKMGEIVNKWSIGYNVPIKENDPFQLRERELAFVKESVGMKLIVETEFNRECYEDLSIWQYLFNISETILKKAKVLWKKKKWNRSESVWLELKRRENVRGRTPGSRNRRGAGLDASLGETDEEFEQRIEHNKKVAIEKRYLFWFLDACKEECARKGEKFDKEKWIKEWKKITC